LKKSGKRAEEVKVKVPLFVRLFYCRKCGFKKHGLCMAYGGILPAVFINHFLFIWGCVNYVHENEFEKVEFLYGKTKMPTATTQAKWMKTKLGFKPKTRRFRKIRGKFKPKTAYEKRLWKPDAKLEEED